MKYRRCPSHCESGCKLTRRGFLGSSVALLAGSPFVGGCALVFRQRLPQARLIQPCGPASCYTPKIKAAFVRRKEEYGFRWPGAVYDGHAARRVYTDKLMRTVNDLGLEVDLRSEPIYSLEEAVSWIADAKGSNVDGLFVILLDRQEHSWPTVQKTADSGMPAIIYSPVGSSFTVNTVGVAGKKGCVTYSTDDFSQAAYGVKMLKAAAKMHHTRCVVIAGDKEMESKMADLGITLQYVPASVFVDTYNGMLTSNEILSLADEYIHRARHMTGATRQDVINGIKSYYVAGQILERYKGDAITMDCLGVLHDKPISLPCIAWSRMNDDGIPAACEADIGAAASHVIVQYLFDRPGFQQDPVAETARGAVIGAHCSCPTRLNGFDKAPEPFDLRHHHAERDAVPRTIWKIGQRVSCVDVLLATQQEPTTMLISAGTVIDNVRVPPAGGCVVSVMVRFDGGYPVLSLPGFHQIFFYGDYRKELVDFCQLIGIEAKIV